MEIVGRDGTHIVSREIVPAREGCDQQLAGYARVANDLRERVVFRSLAVLINGWDGAAARIAYRTTAEFPGSGPNWTAAELASFAVESGAGDSAPVAVIKRAKAGWAIAPIGGSRPATAFLLLDRVPSSTFTETERRNVDGAANAMAAAVIDAEMRSARELLVRERRITRDMSERLIEAGESHGWQESAQQELQRAFDSLTEQKRELEGANRLISATHTEMQRAFDDLKVANTAKTRFLATVSHELKTPLTSISAFTDILRRNRAGNLDERELKQLEVVHRNVHRLNLLINDLLDLTRIDAGTLVLELDDFRVADLIWDVSAMFDPILRTRDQKLVVEDGSEGFWLTGDRDRVEQLITNLVTNASKFSPDHSPISMKIDIVGDWLQLTISDCGVGIPEDEQGHIFDAFYRVDNEQTRAVPGTGVGLYISASIVSLHGGDISVESQPGHGSTFRAVLPGVIDGPSDEHMMREAARLLALQDHRSRLEETQREAA